MAERGDVDPTASGAADPPEPLLTINDVSKVLMALENIFDWYALGTYLEVASHELAGIQAENHTICSRLIKMLEQWLRSGRDRSWRKLVEALYRLGELTVADNICRNLSLTTSVMPKYLSGHNPSAAPEARALLAQKNKQRLVSKFSSLVNRLSTRLTELNIEFISLQTYLTTFGCDHERFVDDLRRQNSLPQLICVVSHHKLWDYLNFDLAQDLVEEFAKDDKKCVDLIEEYKRAVTGYLLTTEIVHHISAVRVERGEGSTATPPEDISSEELCSKLTVKLDIDVTTHSLKYVEEVWKTLLRRSQLPKHTLLLREIAKSSLILTWLLPKSKAGEVADVVRQNTDKLQLKRVILVTIDGLDIFEADPIKVDDDLQSQVDTVEVQAMAQAKPKLSQLHKLVRPHIAEQWEDLSIELELGDEDDGQFLDSIKTDNSGDPLKCFTSAIKVWLQGKGRQPATWETLYTGLKEVQQTEGALRAIEGNIFKGSLVTSTSAKLPKLEHATMTEATELPSPAFSETIATVKNPDDPIATILPAPLQDSSNIPICAPPSSFQTGPPISIPAPAPIKVLPFPNDLDNPDASLFPRTIDFSLKLDPPKQVRDYQWELADPGIRGENYIIVAPTGSGKTLVAALVISSFLKKRADLEKKVIFVVNTRPLAEQQTKQLDELIPGAKVMCSIGDEVNMNIKDVLRHSDIIVCTAGKLLDEIKNRNIGFVDIGLIVMDECHHTRKQSPQARILKRLLETTKQVTHPLPQVIGLTASPGAGENPDLDMQKTLDHLITLCALMNATSGIKIVEHHKEELGQFTNKPTFNLENIERRKPDDPVVACITAEMIKLEQRYGLSFPFRRWSQEYEAKIIEKKRSLEISLEGNHRNEISTLNLLRCYSHALNIYMDLRYEDAVSSLKEFNGFPKEGRANPYEQQLAVSLDELTYSLTSLPLVPNPLLLRVEAILCEQFQKRKDAKGIFFVRTKKHASAICDWIGGLPSAQQLGIHPRVITGHTRETGHGMTQVEQEQVMKYFREGKCNLLVATSVAEEGLDVPACNLVIRFQHVSNEISKTQTIGRARAEESEGFTILSSDSKKTMQELKNEELLILVEKTMQFFPKGHYLKAKLQERQDSILKDYKLKQVYRRQKSTQYNAKDVQLFCKKCKVLACNGRDIRTTRTSTHYIVPNEEFKQNKIHVKPHSKPKTLASGIKQEKVMSCAECDAEWGVMVTWPHKGYETPVLRCKSFIFHINGELHPVGKWSDAPFTVPEFVLSDDETNSD